MNFAEGLAGAHQQLIEKTSDRNLQSIREKAFTRFQDIGWPTRKTEDWKYTSLKPIKETEVSFEQSFADTDFEPLKLKDCFNLVLANGTFCPEQSDSAKQVEIRSLKGEELSAFLKSNSLKPHVKSEFPLLNEAFASELLLLDIPEEQSLEKPIHLIHLSLPTQDGQASFSNPWVLLRIGKRSKAQFIESYVGQGSSNICNSVTELELASSSKLQHIRLHKEPQQSFHLGTTRIHQYGQSELESLVISLGNKLLRHDLRVGLREEGSSSTNNAVYITRGEQHHDLHSWISHEVGHCYTRQIYKGLLDDKARAVFAGQIHIAQDAQKANSEQLNNNLLLSREAEANSKPELEIYADDVKATHGSTTGQLNEDEVLYLQTRGIARSKAIQMISRGFALDLIMEIENPILKDYAISSVKEALSELHHLEEQNDVKSR